MYYIILKNIFFSKNNHYKQFNISYLLLLFLFLLNKKLSYWLLFILSQLKRPLIIISTEVRKRANGVNQVHRIYPSRLVSLFPPRADSYLSFLLPRSPSHPRVFQATMAWVLSSIMEILNRPNTWRIVSDLLLFVSPLWLAVFIGLLVGWAWKPDWAVGILDRNGGGSEKKVTGSGRVAVPDWLCPPKFHFWKQPKEKTESRYDCFVIW